MRDTNLIEDLRLLHPPDWNGAGWIAAALLVLATAGLWFAWRNRKQPIAVTSPSADEALAAWAEAMREIERCSALLRTELSREYAIAATGVVRRYLERRFGLHAPRLTTEEFFAAVRVAGSLPEAHRGSLGDYLTLCDLMKFGRALAESAELQQLHQAAIRLIVESRPAPASPAPATP
jgi:hypothetical protein